MDSQDLQLTHWDEIAEAKQLAIARAVQSCVGLPLHLTGIHSYEMGDQKHSIALFDYAGSAFALIPGATVTLGYDTANPYKPTAEQLYEWGEIVEEYRETAKALKAKGVRFPIQGTLDAYVASSMTPLRTVPVAPFLVEVNAWPL
jgi:hypothetical protein